MPSFDKQFISTFLLCGWRVHCSVNIETIFHIISVYIYVTLNVKPLKKCMYFWVSRIACTSSTLLYINYTTNGFVPVVWKSIIWCYASSKNILSLWVYFSRVSCLFFEPTSSLLEYILVKSLVYFWSLYPRFTSLFLVESIL